MSKAIAGIGMLGAAVGVGTAIFFSGGALLPALAPVMASLVLSGVSMEAGAIASALSSNRGSNLTIRQPSANRQIVYGTQMIGGVVVYESTTGSHHDQRNFVIALAGHTIDSIVALYLDGREVHFDTSSYGNVTRNGVNFGGSANSTTYADAGNNRYNFGGLVYCEARFGDQQPGDVISGLTENDPNWAASSQGSPYLGGVAYVYLKIEDDATQFPGDPEIRFLVRGKQVYDPRTGQTAFSNNWALCVADLLTDQEIGLGEDISAINTAQWIAAANNCSEAVPLANGQTETRWNCDATFDTGVGPGDMLESMMPAAQGRLSRVGGQWYIFPAYYQGPSLHFTENDLLHDFVWTAARPLRERYNRVQGDYKAPSYPYAVAGNLFDSNGFYDGTRQNNFSFAFQRTSAPYYAQDSLHGYAVDPWLTADQNKEHWLTISHSCVISVGQAQRTFKVALLRNRLGAGKTTLTLGLAAYQAIPLDVITFDYAPLGWVAKQLEVVGVRFRVESQDGEPPTMMVDLDVQETDPSIYTWSTTEELTPTVQPASLQLYAYQVQPPTGLVLTDGAATAVTTPDGVVRPRISASWTAPADVGVSQVQVQMQLAGSSSWLDAKMVDVGNTAAYVDSVVAGQSYLVRVRGITPRGATSAWLTSGNYTVSGTHSAINSLGLSAGLIGVAPNNATIDSVLSGSTATMRVYGPGGTSASYTQYLGSQSMTLPAASFTGQATAKTLTLLYNTSTNQYAITQGTTPSDSYIYIGQCTTVSSTGSGGTSGGGGSSPYKSASST